MRIVLIWAVTAIAAVSAQSVSTNGRCGPSYGNRVCKGWSDGDCCSQYGWCGSTSGHCGTGCQTNFGTCSGTGVTSAIRSSTLRTSTVPGTRSSSIASSSTRASSVASSSTRTSSAATASPSVQISKNGRCGYLYSATGGFNCKGSEYGNCCSQYSYCGSTSAYCGTGCQPGFGTCSGISSSVRSSSTSSMPSSSASSSTRSSSTLSSVVLVSSSTQVSSLISTPASSSTSSSISTPASSLTSLSIAVSSTSRSIAVSSASSSIAESSTSSSTAVSSSAVVSSTSVTLISSTSSTPVASSDTSSLSSAITVSSISTSTAEPITSVSSTPSPTPTIVTPLQLVRNPSFELGDGTNPTDWAVGRQYVIDADNSGRFQSNAHTGSYSIRGRGRSDGGYDLVLIQDVTVVPGASYNIEVFAKQTTYGFCSVSVYFGDRTVFEYIAPGVSYTPISGVINIPEGNPLQQSLNIDGACSLPATSTPEVYDLFIDDVTMTLIV